MPKWAEEKTVTSQYDNQPDKETTEEKEYKKRAQNQLDAAAVNAGRGQILFGDERDGGLPPPAPLGHFERARQ